MMYNEDLLPKHSSEGASGAVSYGNALSVSYMVQSNTPELPNNTCGAM